MDTNAAATWGETLHKEKSAHASWVKRHGSGGNELDSDEEDDRTGYEEVLKRMQKKGGLSRKIGSYADKDQDPPMTPSQDLKMIKSKMPPLVRPRQGELDGYNMHEHIPGYTGFFPGQKCREYLLLKPADKQTGESLNDLSLRYKIKFAAPNIESALTTNQHKDQFGGKLRDPDLADWANHRKKSEITEYVRTAIRLHVNIKASGHG